MKVAPRDFGKSVMLVIQRKVNVKLEEARLAVIESAIELAREIKAATPVSSGRCAENWSLALNGVHHDYDSALRGNGSGPVRGEDDIQSFQLGRDQITLHNPTPYLGELEFLGESDKAPAGFIRSRTLSFPHELRTRVVERMNRGR